MKVLMPAKWGNSPRTKVENSRFSTLSAAGSPFSSPSRTCAFQASVGSSFSLCSAFQPCDWVLSKVGWWFQPASAGS